MMSKSDDADADRGKEAPKRRSRAGAEVKKLDSRSAADVAFVDALARLLKEHELAEIEVSRETGEDQEFTVRLSRQGALTAVAAPAALPPAPLQIAAPAAAAPAPAADAAPAKSAADDPTEHPGCVTSPMVGTVYLQPEPDAAAFVEIGDSVSAGQTLLIIEAMKTMNQIPSPKSGVVKAILVENAQPIEFGAPLVILE
ncbi:MAG: acetyl-CoA carboxylase biotin carboxyl carrier protein [Pseudomonadota bacterium]